MGQQPPTAFLFPGQGAQSVGMAADAYKDSSAGRAVFEQADEVLGVPLSRVILEGPADELVRSHNAQPAILCASIALLEAARERLGEAMLLPIAMAGHSLGEYTALVAAGALDLATGLRLVRTRGELMQAAAESVPSGMAAVIGLDVGAVEAACDGTGAQVANDNSVEQTVIAGPKDALERAAERAKSAGARRVMPLEVAGAFHTEVMRPAQEGMERAIAHATIVAPQVPVIANTSVTPLSAVDEVRNELASQVCGCVRWRESVEYMAAQGVARFVEIGPGKVLSGLARRIAPDREALSVNGLDAIEALT